VRVLITGGLGTIGSYLTAEHLKKGDHVSIIDNFSIGSPDNLEHLVENVHRQNLDIHNSSISNKEVLDPLMSGSDICYHLAAVLGTIIVVKNPIKLIETNMKDSHIVVESASQNKTFLVVPSTSMVYGNPEGTFQGKTRVSEDDDLFINANLKKRLWWYAVTKMADEVLVGAYMAENLLDGLIVRPFNVVSPVQSPSAGFVIPRFLSSAMRNEDLLVYGDGSQRRTFTWVKDFNSSLIEVVDKGAKNITINIGSTHEISILDLAKLIIDKTNSNSRIRFTDPSKTFDNQFVEIQSRIPSTDLLKRIANIDSNSFKKPEFLIEQFINYYNSKKGDSLWSHKNYY